jgi:hypothetical protein
VKTRRAIDRALQQRIAGYARFTAAQQSSARAYQALVTQQLAHAFDDRAHLDLGAVVSDQLDSQKFKRPYPLYAVDLVEGNTDVADSSLADPQAGFVINNITFDRDEHNSIWDELTGFVIGPHMVTRSSVGVNYVVPRTGRLTFSAVLHNLFNYVTYSLTDNFGFSHGEVNFSLGVFVRVIRGDTVIGFDRPLYQNGLVAAGGADLTGYSFSGLNMTIPYTFSATTEETFEQGETIQVMVGSSVEIESQLNDMESFVKATLAWQVKNVYLGI